jgi:hypothetical protein
MVPPAAFRRFPSLFLFHVSAEPAHVLPGQPAGTICVVRRYGVDDIFQIIEVFFHFVVSHGKEPVIVTLNVVVDASQDKAEDGVIRHLCQLHVQPFVDANKCLPTGNSRFHQHSRSIQQFS